jgi:drug/metabolite transporter (DMT)-like permease
VEVFLLWCGFHHLLKILHPGPLYNSGWHSHGKRSELRKALKLSIPTVFDLIASHVLSPPHSHTLSLCPLQGNQSHGKRSELKEALMLSIPTVFDLIATVLMNVGLLSVTASVYQMMRGAEMLFAAAFAVFFLGRSLNKYHYLGISCCAVGGAFYFID